MPVDRILQCAIGLVSCWTLSCWGLAVSLVGFARAVTQFDDVLNFPLTIFSYSIQAVMTAFACTVVLFLMGLIAVPVMQYFRESGKPKLGTSRFGAAGDAKRAGLFKKEGLWLGQAFNRTLRLSGFESVLAVAPTGSGKTTCLAIPNILTWTGSTVANDMKGELYKTCVPLLKKQGISCYQFSPFNDTTLHYYNPLMLVRRDADGLVHDLMLMAQTLIPSGQTSSQSFWQNNSQMLFVSLCLYLIEENEKPTLGDVFDLAHQKDLRTWCRNCLVNDDVQHSLFENLVQDIIDGDKETVSNIITSFRTSLKCLALPSVRRATSRHTIDLRRLREKKCFVALTIPPTLDSNLQPLVTLFWAQLLNQLTLENNPKGHAVFLLLDEFGNIGCINALAGGMTYLRSYRVRLMVIVQHMGQLLETYGRHTTRSFAGAKAKIIYTLTDMEDAAFFSRQMGRTTLNIKQRSVQSGRGGSHSTQHHWQARELMSPDELMRLPMKQGVLLLEGQYPLKIQKKPWYQCRQFNILRENSGALKK